MADERTRAGERYATADLVAWLDALHVEHDGALREAFEAPDRHGIPAIQLGRSDAKTVYLLLRLIGARRVVEIGTLVGYSTLWLARATGPEGRVWTLEIEPRHAELARAHLAAAGCADRVEVLVGPALERLPRLESHGPFDAVFIDADKGNYDAYGRWAARHVRPGGLLIADNAHYFGKLLDPDSAEAAAMRRFHQEAAASFDTVCIPTPDGLLAGIRRG
ncbi:MAG: O-methyltransferase [Myxococcota bacterium]|nr:O-methyltransferase [Myxococcota bacterium]MDW8362650.1 O-methyltransferase [Myxococcales bacterium]